MAGSGLYWARGEDELVRLAEALGIPVFLNGLGRGCLPADHELAFSRARGVALKGPIVALVIGVPLDFRLGFGASFGEETKIVRLDVAPERADREPAARTSIWSATSRQPGGDSRWRRRRGDRRTAAWLEQLGALEAGEAKRRAGGAGETRARRCTRFGSTASWARSSTATRSWSATAATSSPTRVASSTPTSRAAGWTRDPFGCLGAGPGQAIGAKLAHPERQVCLLLGDGAFGFAGMEFDTMARHGLGVVGVMGNNGIWALEHHPMKFLYGYSVAAELRPETRYDQMVESLGCDGVLVREPERAAAGA